MNPSFAKFMEGTTISARQPWLGSMGEIPASLEYFTGTMYESVRESARKYPKNIAIDFMGGHISYPKFISNIDETANALARLDVKVGDKITIAMPNCPQAIYMLYAINKLGAIANLVHPLSSEKELEFYINDSESKIVLTLDPFYGKFEAIRANTKGFRLILARIPDALTCVMKLGYALTEGRKVKPVPKDADVIWWNDFIKSGRNNNVSSVLRAERDASAILYSGGTTGTTKGILLTNFNFNALGAQIYATNPMYVPGDKMLAAMPIFHGFGLGICIHAMLSYGGRCVLVPRFTPKSYAKLITKYKCNFIAGVPTLFEALLRMKVMDKSNLSCLKGVFSGGDSLSIELKKKMDAFLSDHKANIKVREGYGTTETVTACCLTPPHMAKEGSIGIPFPDTYIKIVEPDTDRELPYGEEGEILLAGPTTMREYVNHPDETAKTLRTHADGLTWVYTGDLGYMDEDGFIYFRGRRKRMIVTSGYNVYPAQLENIIDACPLVQMSCVIGVPDEYRMHRVKAFVMLKRDLEKSDETLEAIMEHCRKNIAKYAMPREIEFRDEMPKTLIGKVAYRALEEEEAKKAQSKE